MDVVKSYKGLKALILEIDCNQTSLPLITSVVFLIAVILVKRCLGGISEMLLPSLRG
jgi:hypothetical protein